MPILEVKNLCKSYDGAEVLRGIGFSLERGEVLAIIGSSGSGKTTLLRCLNFLVAPDAGSISVGGELLLDADEIHSGKSSYSDAHIRRNRLHFGLVFQSFNLFPQYTVRGNITLAPTLALEEEVRVMRKKKGAAEARAYREEGLRKINDNADALLERVGLSAKRDEYPCRLSGGQQQRVAIARALAMTPDILCFDEPTSALDPELTGEVLSVIRGLKSGDSTMIVVTHEMEFARQVADRVIFMSEGVIAEDGAPDELFGNPKSTALRSFLNKSQND